MFDNIKSWFRPDPASLPDAQPRQKKPKEKEQPEPTYTGPREVCLKKGQDFSFLVPNDIKHIVFTDDPLPKYYEPIDFSLNNDMSVIGYITDKYDERTRHYERDTLTITSCHPGVKIMAHQNCCNFLKGKKEIISIDLKNLDTSNTTIMTDMFSHMPWLRKLDLSGFDMGKCISTVGMFTGDWLLNEINMQGWKTPVLEYTFEMFQECNSLKYIDLSHFDWGSISSVKAMFRGCKQLETVNLGRFAPRECLLRSRAQPPYIEDMFVDCPALKTLILDKESADAFNRKTPLPERPILRDTPDLDREDSLLVNEKHFTTLDIAKNFVSNMEHTKTPLVYDKVVTSFDEWKPDFPVGNGIAHRDPIEK